MNKNLTLMVANLLVKSKGGEELPSKLQRLRDEIKKSTQGEDSVFGKFHGLLESFREIIPEEKQRYHAAIKALSTTSKLSQKEVVKAIGDQLEELKILEKELLPALPAWRDEMKTMEARAKQITSEIAKLREKITQLENEEKGIQSSLAAREKETELVEQSIKELFSSIGTEVTQIKTKVAEYTAEPTTPPPAPHKPVVKSSAPPAEKKSVVEQNVEIHRPQAQKDTEWQKTCPNCGGRLNFHTIEKMWMCYSCAYEEPGEGHEPVQSAESGTPSSRPSFEESSSPASTTSFAPSRTPFIAPSSTPDSAPTVDQPSSKTKTARSAARQCIGIRTTRPGGALPANTREGSSFMPVRIAAYLMNPPTSLPEDFRRLGLTVQALIQGRSPSMAMYPALLQFILQSMVTATDCRMITRVSLPFRPGSPSAALLFSGDFLP